ncbi:hypothetical protein DFQ27_003024 [Actinomortierella ambigua]|uniref:Uncharacterized protein n=1 Tax=Actinomortierella ambigua TaxID=1343610 RepID=A0A9P6QIJ4_9FUNG|nr:hypothetical protein DFQ27_003024 [Actinomortierella ambigua]
MFVVSVHEAESHAAPTHLVKEVWCHGLGIKVLGSREKPGDLGHKIPADKNVDVEVVTKAAKFLTAFEKFYSEAMTLDLFNEMGWRCMYLSLIDAELDDEYKKWIEASQDRTFQQVQLLSWT